MVDAKFSDLPAVVTPADTDLLALVNGGASKKMTLNQLVAYIEARGRVHNASTANQSGFSADSYLLGSDVSIPQGRIQAKSKYWCKFNVTKTGAGTATPILNIRVGTAGSANVTDASRGTLTFSAQTAVADEGTFEINAIFRAGGASAILATSAQLSHRLSITGLGVGVSEPEFSLASAFDVTGAGLFIGLSVNGGTSASWTVNVVDAMLSNLA